MSNISASQVKELREKTGLGLMDCKKALEGSNGDMDMAIEELRKTSGIKASKKSGRSAADGLIGIKSNGSTSFMLEVNCETDFVARDDSYIAFTSETLDIYSNNSDKSLEELLTDGIEDSREKLVQKLGENIVVRRVAKTDDSSVAGSYLHSNKKIGCIVSLDGGNEALANDIAMHAAATDPMAVSPADIPEEVGLQACIWAEHAYRHLSCRGIIRADYRWNDKANQLFMLEVNTQPGMTATSLVPEQARFLGMSGEELVNHLLEIAQCDD